MIPKKMTAVAKMRSAPGAELITTDVPELLPFEALIKVTATAICGTDAHIYHWDGWAEKRVKHFPQIMGHELSGDVVRVGRAVTMVEPGDYVSAETHMFCGRCRQCLNRQYHICSNLKILGIDRDGCFADYIALPEKLLWRNDPALPPGIAAAQEPLGNSVYTTLVEPVTGKSVVIFGDGPTGLFAVGVAKAGGASRVILVGLDEFRMEIGRRMGADMILHGHTDDVEKIVCETTGGYGADVVLEMAGAQESVTLGLKIVRKGGRFCAFGIPSSKVTIDINKGIIFKGLTLYGINGRLLFDTWLTVRDLLESGKLDISPVITHHMPLTEFDRAFHLMSTQPRITGKIVLYPDTSKIPLH